MLPKNPSPKIELEKRYNSTRANLLLVAVFTAVNVLLLVTNSNTYFLFSAYIPYALADLGMYFCGLYPSEYYGEEIANMQFLDTSVFAVFMGIAVIVWALYLLSWIFSKKNRVGWLIFSLVFFAVDTAAMLLIWGFQADNIIDIVFHIWVIVSLVLGLISGFKLKKLKAEESEENVITETEQAGAISENSAILRIADPYVKARTLLEADVLGHNVVYRRVKRVNELVIDGNVYDEFTSLVEGAHTLKASFCGHLIEAGFDGAAHSFLMVDGEIVEKKLRLM